MWVLRVLSGSQAGKSLTLKSGSNSVGRTSNSDVTIASGGVSKDHAEIVVTHQGIEVVDKGSSNGTFVNGVKVRRKIVSVGDKISFYDVVCELIPAKSQIRKAPQQNLQQPHAMNQPMGPAPLADQFPVDEQPIANTPTSFQGKAEEYIEDVVLPGVYKLPQWFEFKWVLGVFVMAFILFVTSLSSIPMMRILKDSIESESQNRARTIAKALAKNNYSAIDRGLESSLSVVDAESEPGVKRAYIIAAADGRVLAPARDAGQYLDLEYAHKGRKMTRASVAQVSDSTIVAMEPIQVFNGNTNLNSIRAFSVVEYNMGALAVDQKRTLSLFIQTFFIALIIGGILFFFMYKMIEFPIKDLQSQVNDSLRSGSASLETTYKFPVFTQLVTMVNSLLNRALNSGGGFSGGSVPEKDRYNEINNMMTLVGYAAVGVQARDNHIVAANNTFFEKTGLQPHDILNSPIDNLLDQALKLSIQDLVSRLQQDPEQIATNDLEFSGESYQITAQVVFGAAEPAYYIIALLPLVESEVQYA